MTENDRGSDTKIVGASVSIDDINVKSKMYPIAKILGYADTN